MPEFLSLGFVQRAFAAGIVVAVLCALLSVHVVLRRMAFIGVGISHAAFGGLSLGLLLGAPPMLSGVLFSLAVAGGIGSLNRRLRLHEDTSIGILFATTMALGVVFLGLSRRYNVDLFGYLFGSILAVTPLDIYLMAGLGVPVAGFLLLTYKELYLMSFNEELARVAGLPVAVLHYGLLAAMALTIVLSIKVVGIILVSALVVIPAAAARQLTYSYPWLTLWSVVLAVLAVCAGLVLSYYLDIASGAAIVLTAAFLFILCAITGRLRR